MSIQTHYHKAIATTTLLSGLAFAFIVCQSTAIAGVTGECANCHTMHNSQGGASVSHAGSGAAWNGGQLTGGSDTGPQDNLLVSDCVGCHSSSTNQTIINVANSRRSRPPIPFDSGH